MLQRSDMFSGEWVKFCDAVVGDDDCGMRRVDSNHSELLMDEVLQWPHTPSTEMEEGWEKVQACSSENDTCFNLYGNDPRVLSLVCEETEVDIRMALWNADRRLEMETNVFDFFALYNHGFFDDALQLGITLLTQCDFDSVQYDMKLLSSVRENVNSLLLNVMQANMEPICICE
ncbi:hypothetical protein T484DRAFT_1757045 [Baffinella frigidus]|nr:hypothetical protein T484DRAFT_1757045 [Cryptophyta sp. CCMP2293]